MTDPQLKEGMLCPVCRIDLLMTDRQGVEIDYCPRCRGVWLDRGELDKLVERSASAEPARGTAAPQASVPSYQQARDMDEARHRDRGYRDYDDDDRYRGGRRKKKSWLGDMFEFD